jgi:hypothetical protein
MTGSLLNNKVIITGKPEIIYYAMPEVMKSKFSKPCHIYRFYKFSPVPPSLLKNITTMNRTG